MSRYKLISYRTTSCGFCKKWIKFLRDNGLEVVDNVVAYISLIKNQCSISNNLKSCHTAEMGNYFIEGHVLFESIKKLNLKSPTIAGIAIPAMPYDSPAMEVHNYGSYSHYHYKRYEVYLEIISNKSFLIKIPLYNKKLIAFFRSPFNINN